MTVLFSVTTIYLAKFFLFYSSLFSISMLYCILLYDIVINHLTKPRTKFQFSFSNLLPPLYNIVCLVHRRRWIKKKFFVGRYRYFSDLKSHRINAKIHKPTSEIPYLNLAAILAGARIRRRYIIRISRASSLFLRMKTVRCIERFAMCQSSDSSEV